MTFADVVIGGSGMVLLGTKLDRGMIATRIWCEQATSELDFWKHLCLCLAADEIPDKAEASDNRPHEHRDIERPQGNLSGCCGRQAIDLTSGPSLRGAEQQYR